MNFLKNTKVIRIIGASLVVVSVISLFVTINTITEPVHGELKIFIEKVQEVEPEVMLKEPVFTSLGQYTVTAYCGCEICCGEWSNNRPEGVVYGAAMEELKQGVSIATSKDFDFGTNLIIDDVEYTVQDRIPTWVVKRYEGKIIDVYFSNHDEAVKFGKQIKEVYILEG